MSYNLTTMESIYHIQDEILEVMYNNSPVYNHTIESDNFYISPTSSSGRITLTPNYTVKNTTTLRFTFVPGGANGWCWVGHMGTTAEGSYDDGNDFRLIDFGSGRVDVHTAEENLTMRLDEYCPKSVVEMTDGSLKIWQDDILVEQKTWTPGGTWNSNANVYLFPRNENDHVMSDFKLYNVTVTDSFYGTIYDAKVDENGLYDFVSHSYTSTPDWTIGEDQQ